MAYRIGRLGWKFAARMGQPLTFRVEAHKDEESGTYWASSSDLDGLAVSADTLDELHREILVVARELLSAEFDVAKPAKAEAEFHMSARIPCAA